MSAAPVGADVEQVRPLHPAMARRLAQADCGDLQPFELWTLRESWFKAPFKLIAITGYFPIYRSHSAAFFEIGQARYAE